MKKNGNNNLAVGNANKKYDVCATNPSAPVCSGTGVTSKLPGAGQKAKPKKGGRSGQRRSSGKTKKRKTKKRKTKKRKTKRKTKRVKKTRNRSRR